MKRLLLISMLLCPAAGRAQPASYNRAQVAQSLQDGAWDEVIGAAQTVASPDGYLLQSAGYAAYQAGDKTAAINYYDHVLAIDSSNKQALYYSAVILKSDERYHDAIPLLERLCANAPGVAQYHVLMAECYATQNKSKEVVSQLRWARQLSPASAVIANKLVNAWIKTKDWDSAAMLLRDALRQHPREPALIITAISFAYTRKQFTLASSWTDSLIATGRMRYEALLTGLYADMEAPNYRHAIQLGSVITALGSETEDVLYYTALARQHLGEWRRADTLLRQCVARVLRPNLEGYYVALAEGAAKEGQAVRSKAYYDTACYLFKNPLTLYRQGISLEAAGRKHEALQAYKKYLALPTRSQDTSIARYARQVLGLEQKK